MDFSNFEFRCSSLGHIMTDAKGKSYKEQYKESLDEHSKSLDEYGAIPADKLELKKSISLWEKCEKLEKKIENLKPLINIPHLSDSCKTHLADVYTRAKYNRREDIKSKYLEKGLQLEEDAITEYSLAVGEMHRKNTEQRNNGWIKGSLDLIKDGVVADTKVSWSIFQFNRTRSKPLLPLYKWQVDGYMWLWDAQQGKVVHVLIDTPEHMIKAEERKLMYEMFGSKDYYDMASEHERAVYTEACAEIRRNHTYGDIPQKEKIHEFMVNRSDERIEKIKKRITDCRYYLNNFLIIKPVEETLDEAA